jgi:hypothetical protein
VESRERSPEAEAEAMILILAVREDGSEMTIVATMRGGSTTRAKKIKSSSEEESNSTNTEAIIENIINLIAY